MTLNEANCFAIMKNWKRKALRRRLAYHMRPVFPGWQALSQSGLIIKILYVFFVIAFSPFICAWWILRAAFGLIVFPLEYLKTLLRPRSPRAPGERNIQGIHNAFSSYFDLPLDLYLSCVDQWIHILYPQEPDAVDTENNVAKRNNKSSKAVKISIKNHIDPQVIDYDSETKNRDSSFHDYAKSQVSRAREEVSKELGYYR